VKFQQLIGRNLGKPVSIAEALLGRPTRWIADKFGVSDTTARRWRRGVQAPTQADRRNSVLKSPDKETRRRIAASAMRAASAINVGKLGVDADTGRAKGTRQVGLIHLGNEGRARMAEAADALERGDEAEAARLHSEAILHSDGRDYGPLHAEDYGPGFHYI
jgi:hypothetical protein